MLFRDSEGAAESFTKLESHSANPLVPESPCERYEYVRVGEIVGQIGIFLVFRARSVTLVFLVPVGAREGRASTIAVSSDRAAGNREPRRVRHEGRDRLARDPQVDALLTSGGAASWTANPECVLSDRP